jgi:hypothetical protein
MAGSRMSRWVVTFHYVGDTGGYEGTLDTALDIEARTPTMALRKALAATTREVRGHLVSVDIDPAERRVEVV